MAPKRGRPAAASDLAARKKPAKADVGVPKLCGLVSKALEGTPGFSESVVKMLVVAVPTSLAILKEERHPFQDRTVNMIGEALAAQEAVLDTKATEAASKLAEAMAEKDRLAGVATEVEEMVKQLATAESAAKATVSDGKAAHQAAVDAATDAKAKQASGDAELNAAANAKAELEALQKEHLVPLVRGTATDAKGSLKAVAKAAKEFVTESSLLGTLPATLGKPKDSRSTFDALVAKQVEEAAASKLAELAKMADEGEAAKAERVAALASTAQACDTAAKTLKASEAALAEAKVALKAGDNKVKETKAATKRYEADFKKVEKDNEVAVAASTCFKEGALKAFGELKERTALPPPQAEGLLAQHPPAEEAPAEAAPVEPPAAAA